MCFPLLTVALTAAHLLEHGVVYHGPVEASAISRVARWPTRPETQGTMLLLTRSTVAAVHGRASNSSKWTQHSAKRCGTPTLSLSGTRSPSSACGARRRQAHHPQGAVAARRVGPLARHAAALARTNALPAGTALRTTPLRTDRVLLADCDHVPCRDHAAIQVSDQLARHAPPYPDQFGRVRG